MAASGLLFLLALPAGAWPRLGLPHRPCVHCCRPAWPPATPGSHGPDGDGEKWVQLPHVRPTIDISILKGSVTKRWPSLSPARTGTPPERQRKEGAGQSSEALTERSGSGKAPRAPVRHFAKVIGPQPPLKREARRLERSCEERETEVLSICSPSLHRPSWHSTHGRWGWKGRSTLGEGKRG